MVELSCIMNEESYFMSKEIMIDVNSYNRTLKYTKEKLLKIQREK